MNGGQRNRKAFSLVEMVTVLAIIGVSLGIFYSVFFLNWESFDGLIARADLGQDMDQIMQKVSVDGRNSRQVDVTLSPAQKEAKFTDVDGNLTVYTMTTAGLVTLQKGSSPVVNLTDKLDFAGSTFVKNGKSLSMTVALKDRILHHPVTLSSEIEVFPRN